MKYLIAGLGNIGPEYELTRHNIGFLVLDRLAEKEGVRFQSARLADKAEFRMKGKTVHLIKPTTFMNLSGKAISWWMRELNIPLENLIVLVDDLALPFLALRLRLKGSSAGHNGLKSIEEHLGTQAYARLRFGIGNDYPKGHQVDYVLGNFTREELDQLPEAMDKAGEILRSAILEGPLTAMSRFNS